MAIGDGDVDLGAGIMQRALQIGPVIKEESSEDKFCIGVAPDFQIVAIDLSIYEKSEE